MKNEQTVYISADMSTRGAMPQHLEKYIQSCMIQQYYYVKYRLFFVFPYDIMYELI